MNVPSITRHHQLEETIMARVHGSSLTQAERMATLLPSEYFVATLSTEQRRLIIEREDAENLRLQKFDSDVRTEVIIDQLRGGMKRLMVLQHEATDIDIWLCLELRIASKIIRKRSLVHYHLTLCKDIDELDRKIDVLDYVLRQYLPVFAVDS